MDVYLTIVKILITFLKIQLNKLCWSSIKFVQMVL